MDDSTTAEEKSFGIIAQHGGNHSVFMHKTPPFKGCFFLQVIYINTKLLNIKNVILFVAKKMQVY